MAINNSITNHYGEELFKDLMNLVSNSNSFLYKDFNSENKNEVYRIFSYNLPKYSEFKSSEAAMKCRGIMFKVNKEDNSFVELTAMPMDKFFSYGENPDTAKVDFSKIKKVFIKEDGSLLSAYVNSKNELKFKSMKQPEYALSDIVFDYVNKFKGLNEEIIELSNKGYTVNFEFTSPHNRVLQNYEETKLHVLNIRNKFNGDYIKLDAVEFSKKYPNINKILVKEAPKEEILEIMEGKRYSSQKDFEGYVVQFEDNSLMKIKTEWYLSFSAFANMQDFSKYNEYLFKAVINETTDELKSLLHYKNRSENFKLEEKLEDIEKMEDYVRNIYHSSNNFIQSFYKENKDLEQKEFVSKVKSSENPEFLEILMKMKNNKDYDLKEFLIKKFSKNSKIVANKSKNSI